MAVLSARVWIRLVWESLLLLVNLHLYVFIPH